MPKVMKWTLTILLSLTCLMGAQSLFASVSSDLEQLRNDWAVAKYRTPRNQQEAKFKVLIQQAEDVQSRYPSDARVLTWHGTILATYASVRGGIGALPYVKKAKTLLESAIRQNPSVENGMALAVLGSVYSRVPGWPIAFGSKQKARSHLEAALRINPRGIDQNYFYGDFLADEGEYEKARTHLENANRAPIRKPYAIQDRGRKGEVAASLRKLRNAS